MKKVLVAGGAGFIGSHLCETLLSRGAAVTCIDNFVTGSERNIAHLRDKDGFSLVDSSVCSEVDLESDFDTIFHLASPASPVDYQRMPVETILANTTGTYNLLVLAKDCGAVFVYGSSSEVYGDPLEHPQRENYRGNVSPIGPRACYDEAKRIGETLTMVFHKKYGVDARIARIFNTYGPRMRAADGRAVPNFITQALSGKPLTVYGTGDQTRSLCYISDMVEGIVSLANVSKANGEVVNLGNPEEVTVLKLAETIRKLAGSSAGISFSKLPEDDPLRRRPDIGKAASILGWHPKVSLEDGLKETIKWFRGV